LSRTLLIIKPDATERNLFGYVIDRLKWAHFKIVKMRMTTLNNKEARDFYAIHREKPFYDSLVKYMTSGPIVSIVLEKDDAITDLRALVGATNPKEAACGTIRYDVGRDVQENSVHASDSDENAAREIAFFFNI